MAGFINGATGRKSKAQKGTGKLQKNLKEHCDELHKNCKKTQIKFTSSLCKELVHIVTCIFICKVLP